MPISPRFHPEVDTAPSFAFDDLCGTRRSVCSFLFLCARVLLSPFRPAPRLSRHSAVFFPMHQSKYQQMEPMEPALESRPLFILVPWEPERFARFNETVKTSGRDWVMLEPYFPAVFWYDFLASLPFWVATALKSPSRLARRLAQYLDLYSSVHGLVRIVAASGARILVTSYEDSWYSSAASQFAKRQGFLTVNVMHGNCYRHDQFFDASLVFGEYHRGYLEANTSSRTRFVVSGSATIKDTGVAPRPELARSLVHFDQPACDIFPGPVKAEVMEMLATLIEKVSGVALTVKPHPVGADGYLHGFLKAHPEVEPLPANGGTVTGALAGHGISMTAFSTTGLEAIANGTVSLFLNPKGALSTGALAFMQEFELRDAAALVTLVARLVSDADFYCEYLQRQKRTLERYYALQPFDYAGFIRSLGVRSMA
jgi:hypothetical protein